MSLSKPLAHYLHRHGVSYLEVPKEDAFTSATVARGRRRKPRGLAKVVALRNEDHDDATAAASALSARPRPTGVALRNVVPERVPQNFLRHIAISTKRAQRGRSGQQPPMGRRESSLADMGPAEVAAKSGERLTNCHWLLRSDTDGSASTSRR